MLFRCLFWPTIIRLLMGRYVNRDSSMIPPVLKTENLVIRAFERNDLEAFVQYRSQEMVAKYQSWTNYTYQDALELFESMYYSTFGREGN